jgi:hypothetical protein
VTKIDVAAAPFPPSTMQIGELQLRGNILFGDGTVTLKELPWTGLDAPAEWNSTRKDFRFCSPRTAPDAGLVLGLQTSPSPSPSPARPRRPKP